MTRDEAERCCGIPEHILREYEQLRRPCGNDHYDEADIAAMSLLMTLHNIGFSAGEAQRYMRTDGQGQRMEMLERRREQVLTQIHHDERQLERIDWLRHQNRTAQEQ